MVKEGSEKTIYGVDVDFTELNTDLSQIKEMMELNSTDEKLVREYILEKIGREGLENMVNFFYERILQFKYPQSFFTDPAVLKRVKKSQVDYFEEFLAAEISETFIESRIRIAWAHERINLDQFWYITSYSLFINYLIDKTLEISNTKEETVKLIKSLVKMFILDIAIVNSAYLSVREKIISAQADELLELSSPILEITEEIVVIPLLGTLDSSRTLQLMEKILNYIENNSAHVVILDITGVPVIDTATGANLIRAVKAINLMGVECVITGLRAALAQTIVELGIDLHGLVTRTSLSEGILVAMEMIRKRRSLSNKTPRAMIQARE